MQKPLDRIDLIFALLIFLITFFLGYGLLVPGVDGLFHDDGIYLLTAKSLAEEGRYVFPFLRIEIEQTKYPPVYLSILALIWKLFPEYPANSIYFQLSSLLFCSSSLVLAYLMLVKRVYVSRMIALGALLLLGSSHLYLYFGSVVLSEMCFAFILILVLWSFDCVLDKERRSNLLCFFCGVLVAVLTLCRSAGIFFLPLPIMYLRKSKLNMLMYFSGFVFTSLPWFIWCVVVKESRLLPIGYSYYTGYLSWLDSVLPVYYRILSFNLLEAVFMMPLALFDGLSVLLSEDSYLWGIVLLSGIILFIGWSRLWRTRRFIVLAPILYCLALLLWPGPPLRLLVPILPILLPLMFEGVRGFLAQLRFCKIYTAISIVLVAFLFVCNFLKISEYQDLVLETKIPYLEKPQSKNKVYWKDYEEVFTWIRGNSFEDDIIASNFDPLVYLYTGRKSIMPYELELCGFNLNGLL
jgi:hypothetical protein